MGVGAVAVSYMVKAGMGYVGIGRFGETTGDELEKALSNLRAQGMKNLLIDLRSNSGGLMNQAVDVLDQLVPEDKKLVYTRGRIQSSNADYYSTDRKGKWTDGALVVLVD